MSPRARALFVVELQVPARNRQAGQERLLMWRVWLFGRSVGTNTKTAGIKVNIGMSAFPGSHRHPASKQRSISTSSPYSGSVPSAIS